MGHRLPEIALAHVGLRQPGARRHREVGGGTPGGRADGDRPIERHDGTVERRLPGLDGAGGSGVEPNTIHHLTEVLAEGPVGEAYQHPRPGRELAGSLVEIFQARHPAPRLLARPDRLVDLPPVAGGLLPIHGAAAEAASLEVAPGAGQTIAEPGVVEGEALDHGVELVGDAVHYHAHQARVVQGIVRDRSGVLDVQAAAGQKKKNETHREAARAHDRSLAHRPLRARHQKVTLTPNRNVRGGPYV